VSEDAPAPGEVWRLLTKIDKRLDDMVRQQGEREKLFVLKEVYEEGRRTEEERHRTDDVQLKGIENELHSISERMRVGEDRRRADLRVTEDRRRADRALLLGSLAFPLLVALLTALFLTRSLG
jgi:hypothetical protein